MIGLELGEHLHRVDPRIVVHDPVTLTAEQRQVLHRIKVNRTRNRA
jgi:hypothetical protein